MRSEDPRCGLRCPGLYINAVMAAPTNRREHPTSKVAMGVGFGGNRGDKRRGG